MSVMEQQNGEITLERIINGLSRLKDGADQLALGQDGQEIYWKEESKTLSEAISILSDLQDEGCATGDAFRDWLYDQKLMLEDYQSMIRRFRIKEKPYHQDGVWHCPTCDHRVNPNHGFCHWCGKRLGW